MILSKAGMLLLMITLFTLTSALPPDSRYKRGDGHAYCIMSRLRQATSDHCCQAKMRPKLYNLNFFPFGFPQNLIEQYVSAENHLRPVQTIAAHCSFASVPKGKYKWFDGAPACIIFCEDIRDDVLVELYPKAAQELLSTIYDKPLRKRVSQALSTRRSIAITMICDFDQTTKVVSRRSMRAHYTASSRDVAFCLSKTADYVSADAGPLPLVISEWDYSTDLTLIHAASDTPTEEAIGEFYLPPQVDDSDLVVFAELRRRGPIAASKARQNNDEPDFDEVFGDDLIEFPAFGGSSSQF